MRHMGSQEHRQKKGMPGKRIAAFLLVLCMLLSTAASGVQAQPVTSSSSSSGAVSSDAKQSTEVTPGAGDTALTATPLVRDGAKGASDAAQDDAQPAEGTDGADGAQESAQPTGGAEPQDATGAADGQAEVTPAADTQPTEAPSDTQATDMPALTQTVSVKDVRITLQADAGVFPAGATLHAEEVAIPKAAETAVEEQRADDLRVALTRNFDIKVLDADGTEIQPADAGKVRLSFALDAVKNSNLDTQIYHISEKELPNKTEYQAESLKVEETGDQATVETEGFSYYTVEFTYGDLQYVLEGGKSTPLAKVLAMIGLAGTVTDVEVSNEELFAASNANGNWVLTAKQPFDTTEWMKLTIDGVVYEVTVTDDNSGTSSQGCDGTSAYLRAVADSTVEINYGMLRSSYPSVKVNELTNNNGHFQTDNNTYSSIPSTIRLRNSPTSSSDPSTDLGEWNTLGANKNKQYDDTIELTYANAATLPDGSTSDVIITINNISLYVPSEATRANGGTSKFAIFEIVPVNDGPAIRAYQIGSSKDNYSHGRYGLEETVNIRVANAPADSTFVFTANGIDADRRGTDYQYLHGASPQNNNYSERIEVTSGGTDYQGSGALVYLADAQSGITFTATTSGSKADDEKMNLMVELEQVPVVNYEATSGTGGSISPAGSSTNSFLSETTFTLTAEKTNRKNNVIKTLKIDGAEVQDPSSVLAVSGIPDGNGNYPAYTYTFPKCLDPSETHKIEVEWEAAPARPDTTYPECNDCKNPEPCNDCYNALNGLDIRGYDKDANGVYRGGNAASRVSALSEGTYFDGETKADNTFASPLPYGNVFVDTSKLSWKNSNVDPNTGEPGFKIDIKDNRFKLVGTGATTAGGSSKYNVSGGSAYSNLLLQADLVTLSDYADYPSGSPARPSYPSYAQPTIAYFGPVHSYLMYGNEKTASSLGTYTRDNTVASTGNIANGSYNGVTVQNGTNVIEAAAGSYLYRVTYDDAVVLPDGSRGKLAITTTKVEIESSYTTNEAYIGIQKENEICVNASYVKENVTQQQIPTIAGNSANAYNQRNAVKYFPGRDTIATSSGSRTVRNSVGAKVTYEVNVLYADGTPVEDGIIAYGANDLDLASYESLWGRQPTDTYAGDDPTIANDPVKSKWTGTHEFYEYAEGMQINSGALSYALVPNYNHTNGADYNSGQLPIDKALDENDRYGNKYYLPMQVIATGTSTDGLANGVRFVTTSAGKGRDNSGTFSNPSATSIIDLSGNRYQRTGETWIGTRNDGDSYDTGYAVLLDTKGANFTWTGSIHTNGAVNTWLFDSNFATYLTQSHGTGGGIHLENYKVSPDNCEPSYIEGTAVFGVGSSATVSIVPEDGYRVKQFYVDDVLVTIDEENNQITFGSDSPVSLSVGGTATKTDFTTGKNPVSNPITELKVTRYADGTYDVSFSNAAQGTNIHADFETDYYFQKVWEGAKANKGQLPEKLYLTAVPYVAKYDQVTINNITYEISEDISGQTVFTNATEGDSNYKKQYPIYEDDVAADHIFLHTIGSNKHPASKYPVVVLGDPNNRTDIDNIKDYTYIIMGNDVYKVEYSIDTSDPHNHTLVFEGLEDPDTIDATISVKFERYKDDATIYPRQFEVTKQLASSNSPYVNAIDQDGDVIWQIIYPDTGVDMNGNNSLNDAGDWPKLPIEVEDNDDSNHETTGNHVQRIFWFVTEDIDKLTDKWLLKSYTNDYDNGAAVMSGIASYQQNGASKYEDKTYWYTQSTKDHLDTDAAKGAMADVELAFMSPMSSVINDKSGHAYPGWGGKIMNRIIETKIRAYKEWQGDLGLEEYREKLKMVIKRTYQYAQPLAEAGDKTLTLPTGSVMNTLMKKIVPSGESITGFRRDVEPLLASKLAAIEVDVYGQPITQLSPGETLEGKVVLYTDPDPTSGALLYLWWKNDEICFWTDADPKFIFLNADASGMFKDMPDLKNIPGVGDFNLRNTTNIKEMFAITSGTGGSLENLDYLRKWDVQNVLDMSGFAKGQSKLYKINGIVDWNVERLATTNLNQGFKDMFAGGHPDVANGVKVPFIFYPHFFVKQDGDLDVSTSTTAEQDINDLIYDYDGDVTKNIGTLEEDQTEWTWEIMDFIYSDATKWKYEIYEDAMTEYQNIDGAVTDQNKMQMQRNPDTGYYEYTLMNKMSLYDLTINKTVLGNLGSRDKYFKFRIDLENAGKGSLITMNMANASATANNPSNPPTLNDATEKDYKETMYRYVKKDGTIVVSSDKSTVDAECTADGGTPDTDVKKTTVMGVANDNDEDISGVIKYAKTDADEAKNHVWSGKIETSDAEFAFNKKGLWIKIDGSNMSKISSPADGSMIKYEDIKTNVSSAEAAKSFIWYDEDYSNNGIYYEYHQDGRGWTKVDTGVESQLTTPPDKAWITYASYKGTQDKDAKNHSWTDTQYASVTYVYKKNVWVATDPADGGKIIALEVEPNDTATANHEGKEGQQVKTKTDGKTSFDIYLQHGEEVVIKDLPHGAKYTITEVDHKGYSTNIYNGQGELIQEKAWSTLGEAGRTAEESENGTYFKKTDGSFEVPSDFYADYDPASGFEGLKKYKRTENGGQITYEVDSDGEYFLRTDGRYYKLADYSPEARYESTKKKYVLNVTKAYTNEARAVIPTEIFFNWFIPFILLGAAGGYGVYRYRRRRRMRDVDAA